METEVIQCLAIRELLPEYAVSTLPEDDRREVERHLQWCAGCRKEAAELEGAAGMVGLSLTQAEPPPALEDRVVGAVRRAVPGHRRALAFRAATVIAATVALVALGLAGALVAQQQTAQDRLVGSGQSALRYLHRLDRVLEAFPGQATPHHVTRALLAPSSDSLGTGGALRVTSAHFGDLTVVIVGGLPQWSSPYRVSLSTPSGRRLVVGKIRVDAGGGGIVAGEFSADLRLFRYIQIRDANGHLVLSGSFSQP
jgi:hypothetical protein